MVLTEQRQNALYQIRDFIDSTPADDCEKLYASTFVWLTQCLSDLKLKLLMQ